MKATKKFGALVNLASRRNSRQAPDITYLRSKGILVETPSSLAELPAAINRLGDAGLDVLAVSGGDGTVLSALTAILTGQAFERQPILCLTPDGTTNMTAADIGISSGKNNLNRAYNLAKSGQGKLVKRQTIRLDGVMDKMGGTDPQVGMFFGAIGICRAIEFCRVNLHRHGIVGSSASWLTLLPLLLKNLVFNPSDGVLAGAPLVIRGMNDFDQHHKLDGSYSVLMASTLEKLTLGAKPFWGNGSGLPLTAVQAPPPRLFANILPLLFGNTKRPKSPGYESLKDESYEITYTGQVTLDGELYEAQSSRPIRLSSGGEVQFLVE